MNKELIGIKDYITSPNSEKANDYLIFPFFKKLFSQNKFKKESEAVGADIFIEGRLLVELKTENADWLAGFYQAMHYQKKGLSYSGICVISHNFIGLWHLNKIPIDALNLINNSDPSLAPNDVGRKNANKTNKALEKQILDSSRFLYDPGKILYLDTQLFEFEDCLKNIDQIRNQINPDNFLRKIGTLKPFFLNPLDAIHCFYTILPFWDSTSKVPEARKSTPSVLWLNGKNGSRSSEEFVLESKFHHEFREFVENHYVFTNDEAGITTDYYFSRFDEALAEHNPEYVKQHGIFFTDINLSRFALWFIREKFGEKKLSDKYIVFDPAGGSGNLISSWRRNHIKFKIVSELNPDLLKTIELRLKNDPIQVEQGYCIIPKTHENKGLNFIDKPALEYYSIIEEYLKKEGKYIDKPLAFLLNPPYKNTREEESFRTNTNSNYTIYQGLLDTIKLDAGKERYVLFIAQILELCKIQKEKGISDEPILFIFTPTSWLIPRVGFKVFREIFDKYFKFQIGFFVKSNEFFEVDGTWPISFTIWKYRENKNNVNHVVLYDYSEIKRADLSINWEAEFETLKKILSKLVKGKKKIDLSKTRIELREKLPTLSFPSKETEKYKMQNLYRSVRKEEKNEKIISGWPKLDDRHERIKAPHGFVDGTYVGFMDDGTPVRTYPANDSRYNVKQIETVWFRLDTAIKDSNKMKAFSGPPDNRGYCAYDLKSAQITFLWFTIGKVILNSYPLWANQMEIWSPNLEHKEINSLYSLCFAYLLSDNRCVVTKFEKDNPVQGAPEIFVDNPMCPTNPDSFWSKVLETQVKDKLAKNLVNEIKSLYTYWNVEYCKGQLIENCGLKDEPYFKYFDYPDFVTPYSGLIQIKKYAEVNGKVDLVEKLERIKELTKQVKERIYNLLVNEFGYFE
ncbi:MAG: hypothetical protein KDK90_09755 [Leptospiraceae bacterium]|nr:hypothetical protein [Leptospiraceae bacterium]